MRTESSAVSRLIQQVHTRRLKTEPSTRPLPVRPAVRRNRWWFVVATILAGTLGVAAAVCIGFSNAHGVASPQSAAASLAVESTHVALVVPSPPPATTAAPAPAPTAAPVPMIAHEPTVLAPSVAPTPSPSSARHEPRSHAMTKRVTRKLSAKRDHPNAASPASAPAPATHVQPTASPAHQADDSENPL